MIVVLHGHSHMAMLLFPIFLVLLLHGLVLWTPASSGTITREERKTETEKETETESATGTGTEKESAPARESGSVTTVPRRVSSTVTKSDTDTENMPREGMSGTERVGRKRSGTERDGTGRRRRADTSPLEVTVDVAMRVKKETVTGGTNTKNLKEAKKGRRPAVSPPPSRRAPRRHPQSRRGRALVCAAVPELDTVNLVIFLDNV